MRPRQSHRSPPLPKWPLRRPLASRLEWPRRSRGGRKTIETPSRPALVPRQCRPPGSAARQASCSLREQASLRGLPRRLHRSPIQQAGSVPTAPGHPATPSAPPRALLRPPPVRFQHAPCGRRGGAAVRRPHDQHFSRPSPDPTDHGVGPETGRDGARWRRGGQQASDTPSRPQRERARAVAAAKRLIQRLCSGFSASCLQGSLQIFPGHLFWPFRSHFGNLWRSIPI